MEGNSFVMIIEKFFMLEKFFGVSNGQVTKSKSCGMKYFLEELSDKQGKFHISFETTRLVGLLPRSLGLEFAMSSADAV